MRLDGAKTMTDGSDDIQDLRSTLISQFEREISAVLPEDYKNFLLTWGGGEMEERFFRTLHSGDEVWEVTDMFTVGAYDPALELRAKWDPTAFYDMSEHTEIIGDFIVIGEDDTGCALLLNLENSQIHLLAHDFSAKNPKLRIGESSVLLPVAHDFRQLRRLLLTEEQAEDEDTFGLDWYQDAEERRIRNEKIQQEHRKRKTNKAE
jgi:hypothetical protein